MTRWNLKKTRYWKKCSLTLIDLVNLTLNFLTLQVLRQVLRITTCGDSTSFTFSGAVTSAISVHQYFTEPSSKKGWWWWMTKDETKKWWEQDHRFRLKTIGISCTKDQAKAVTMTTSFNVWEDDHIFVWRCFDPRPFSLRQVCDTRVWQSIRECVLGRPSRWQEIYRKHTNFSAVRKQHWFAS